MTYEELSKQLKAIEKEEDAFCRKCGRREIALKKKYIKEHVPLELKDNQRIIVKLKGKKNYSINGIFRGWYISNNGELRPCLWRKQYSQEDDILSIELHKQQPEGDCRKCILFCSKYQCDIKLFNLKKKFEKKGYIPCPKYEEIVEGGLWAGKNIWPHRYYPKVTVVRDEDCKKRYRLWEGDFCFTEWEADHIEKYYSREPIDYSDELNNNKI